MPGRPRRADPGARQRRPSAPRAPRRVIEEGSGRIDVDEPSPTTFTFGAGTASLFWGPNHGRGRGTLRPGTRDPGRLSRPRGGRQAPGRGPRGPPRRGPAVPFRVSGTG